MVLCEENIQVVLAHSENLEEGVELGVEGHWAVGA
jgi:hypothetical protein